MLWLVKVQHLCVNYVLCNVHDIFETLVPRHTNESFRLNNYQTLIKIMKYRTPISMFNVFKISNLVLTLVTFIFHLQMQKLCT